MTKPREGKMPPLSRGDVEVTGICEKCRKRFARLTRMGDLAPKTCKKCGP